MKRDVAILITTLLGTLYFIYFYLAKEQINESSLGTLGDFIGGNINPVLTFISTILLIETLSLQRKATKAAEESTLETKQTVKEQGKLIKIQIFENSFFNLINLCLEDYKNSKIEVSNQLYTGSKAFQHIEQEFCERKEKGEDPRAILEDIEDKYGDSIFNIVKLFSTVFGFVNDESPDSLSDHYITLTTKLTPLPIIYIICISKLFSDWAVIKPFDAANFFNKKSIKVLIDGYRQE